MADSTLLFWGLLFSSVGLGFFIYGRKQKNAVPFLAGIGLLIFPFFVTNLTVLMIVGLILITLPFVIKI